MKTRDGVNVQPGNDLYRITEGFAQGVNEWRGNIPMFAERVGEPDTPEDVGNCFSSRRAAQDEIAIRLSAVRRPSKQMTARKG